MYPEEYPEATTKEVARVFTEAEYKGDFQTIPQAGCVNVAQELTISSFIVLREGYCDLYEGLDCHEEEMLYSLDPITLSSLGNAEDKIRSANCWVRHCKMNGFNVECTTPSVAPKP